MRGWNWLRSCRLASFECDLEARAYVVFCDMTPCSLVDMYTSLEEEEEYVAFMFKAQLFLGARLLIVSASDVIGTAVFCCWVCGI